MIQNWFFLTRCVVTLVCFCLFLFFLIPKQAREVIQPEDGLTRLRWQILTLLIIIALTMIPSIFTQYYAATGHQYRVLRNVSSLAGGVNLIALTIGWILIFTYRRND